MNKLKFENYLNLRYGIKNILDNLVENKYDTNNLEYIIDSLKLILLDNEYIYIDKAVLLYNHLCVRNKIIDIDYLVCLLEELYYCLILNYTIKVYFIGNDKFELMSNKYLRVPVIFNNITGYDIGKNKKVYKVLIHDSKNVYHKGIFFDKKFYYDELIYKINNISRNFYTSSGTKMSFPYAYYYLKYELLRCKKEEFDTLIVGISYSMRGIIKENLHKKSISLCMSSQDLYYSYKMAKQALLYNNKINKCIIGISYYSFYFDTSKARYTKRHSRELYKLILNDLHNFDDTNEIDSYKLKYEFYLNDCFDFLINHIFNLENLQDDILFSYYSKYKSYFNDEFKKNSHKIGGFKEFFELSLDTKIELSEYFTSRQNKYLKYIETREENYKVIKEFLEVLLKNNIEPIIVVFPSTRYYNERLDPKYKKDFYSIMDGMRKQYTLKLIDLNDYDVFDDTDFFDQDHLNEKGANKATDIINSLIY